MRRAGELVGVAGGVAVVRTPAIDAGGTGEDGTADDGAGPAAGTGPGGDGRRPEGDPDGRRQVPGEDVPAVGTELVNESLTAVGRVVDVFGPVERPYLAVTPADGVAAASLVGRRLYAR